MVGHLVQLKLATIRGSFRPDARDRAGARASAFVLITLTVLALLLAALVWNRSPEIRGSIAVVGGTVIALASYFTAASTKVATTIDPRALVMAGRSPAQAAGDVFAMSFIGIAPACLAVVLLAWIAVWRDHSLALVLAAVGAVISIVMIVTLGLLGSLVAEVARERRIAGDVMSATMLIALLAASPVIFVVVTAPWQQGAGVVVEIIGDALAWSPFGGSWAAPATLVESGATAALAQLGIALAVTVFLVVLWFVLGTRLASGTLGEPRASGGLDLGLFGTFGSTPAGVIAARTLTYWMRDRRYQVVLTTVIAVPLLALVPLALAGVPTDYLALLPVPLLAFFMGWSLHNDLAFDSTALWLHITASMKGRSDRLGRAAPTVIVGVVLVLLGSVVTALITGEWLWAVSVLGVSLALLGAAAGISSVTSVYLPYPVARPGDSPFSQPVRSWGSGVWLHPLTALLAFAAAAPAVVFAVIGIASGVWWWHLIALGCGALVGAGVFAWGIAAGGRAYDRRSSELMTFATTAA